MARDTKQKAADSQKGAKAAAVKKVSSARKGKASMTAKRPRRKTMAAMPPISEQQRYQMIAEAAYYRAEHRGFQGGSPEEDWYAAAAEIDAMLAGEAPPQAH